jgi:hypothetical protein
MGVGVATIIFPGSGELYCPFFPALEPVDGNTAARWLGRAGETGKPLVSGSVDSNQLYLTRDDIRHLWIDGRFPDDWEPRSQDDISLLDVATGSLEMAFAQVAKAWGF